MILKYIEKGFFHVSTIFVCHTLKYTHFMLYSKIYPWSIGYKTRRDIDNGVKARV